MIHRRQKTCVRVMTTTPPNLQVETNDRNNNAQSPCSIHALDIDSIIVRRDYIARLQQEHRSRKTIKPNKI